MASPPPPAGSNAPAPSDAPFTPAITSLLDTDLYKLTMQSAVLAYFPDVNVTYSFTNRTADKKFSRAAYTWLAAQIRALGALRVTPPELAWLRSTCPYLSASYLAFLESFRLDPASQIRLSFTAEHDTDGADDMGNIELHTRGRWVDTILYEIPLLALTSEAYFRFCDTDWTHAAQFSRARAKGLELLAAGCVVSEFGSRRRRDYHTHELVLQGLLDAQAEADARGLPGRIAGTSNVHFAQRLGLTPVGTVAHEWFMGVAAVTGDYRAATEIALGCWIGRFGRGVLGVALTDTFGTPAFLDAFARPIRAPQSDSPALPAATDDPSDTYAHAFGGVRQDSGDPVAFVKTMHAFYTAHAIPPASKTIVFSDALDVPKALHYAAVAAQHGFQASFGVGTYLTNDFYCASRPDVKSVPLNIVIKLSSANGQPAVKISDNAGKNTGNAEKVREVKRLLGYVERDWEGGNEGRRWGVGDAEGEAKEATAAGS